MTRDAAIVLMAAGATFVVVFGGLWARDALARRRPRDVFDYIEPQRCACGNPPRACVWCEIESESRLRAQRALDRGRRERRELLMRDALNAATRAARPLGCPGWCGPRFKCSTPAVCRAVKNLFPTN